MANPILKNLLDFVELNLEDESNGAQAVSQMRTNGDNAEMRNLYKSPEAYESMPTNFQQRSKEEMQSDLQSLILDALLGFMAPTQLGRPEDLNMQENYFANQR